MARCQIGKGRWNLGAKDLRQVLQPLLKLMLKDRTSNFFSLSLIFYHFYHFFPIENLDCGTPFTGIEGGLEAPAGQGDDDVGDQV